MEEDHTSNRERTRYQVPRDGHCEHGSRNMSGEGEGQELGERNRLHRLSASLQAGRLNSQILLAQPMSETINLIQSSRRATELNQTTKTSNVELTTNIRELVDNSAEGRHPDNLSDLALIHPSTSSMLVGLSS